MAINADELRWWSALETAAAVRSRKVSVSEVVEAAIERIEAHDPALNAVAIPLFERARTVCSDQGAAGQGGGSKSVFGGVPMLLKDAGEEIAGTPHWVGTQGLARAGYRSQVTTELASHFERLGFVVVGKSACPELSASSTTEPAGFPPTRNPWSTDRTVGGSSGGSAAAVAAGLVSLAHGSDATGSLRFPASHCGVVTLKPSRNRIPITAPTGQSDPLRAWTQFALARDVNDLCELFAVLSDGPSAAEPLKRPMRVGLLDHDPIIGFPVDAECSRAVRVVGDALALLGHDVEFAYPPVLDKLFKPFWKAMGTIGPSIRLEQVLWMTERLGRPCGPGDLTDDILELAERGRHLERSDIDAAYESVRSAMSGIEQWWTAGFDVLVTPVMLTPPWLLGEDAPAKTGMFCAPFSFTGQPALVVPASITADGLPVGVQLVARTGADELLLDLGSKLQEIIGWLDRRPPY